MNTVSMETFMPLYLILYDKLIVEKIKKLYGYSEMEAYKMFLNSETYRMCTDMDLEMWELSHLDIFDMWVTEKITGNPRNVYFLRSNQ